MAAGVLCPGCGAVVPDRLKGCPKCGTYLEADYEPTRISQRLPDPLRGKKLGDYTVQERIGLGGMGIVYRATHPIAGSVAVKVLRPDVISSEADLQRFLGEAKTINGVKHPGVVSIFGAGDTPDGRKYLVMELLTGESLEARRVRDGKLPTSEVVPILEGVLAALMAVHAAGVVHRDLKPANVFLAKQSDGSSDVKLLDFGLARKSNQQEVSRVAGTPDYISPEHARGRPPGPAADLYALGVMAFHLLTGRLPFIGKNPVEVMKQHVSDPAPKASSFDASIPLAMTELIVRLMAKDPLQRPVAAAVREELHAVAGHLRTAATQQSLPAMPAVVPLGDREHPTAPANAQRDTEPSLVAQAPTPISAPDLSKQGPTPAVPSHLAPTALATSIGTPMVRDTAPSAVASTSPELQRKRWGRRALLAGGGLILVLLVKVFIGLRADDQPVDPPLNEGRRKVETVVEAPTEEPQDWKAALEQRLEVARDLARETKAVAQENVAKSLLTKLETAGEADRAALEQQVAQLESRVGK